MNLLLLLLFAYIAGFFTAMPIGATQIEIVKRSLKGYIYSALMIAMASAASDVIYGTIAFFGIAPFLKNKDFISTFIIFGIILLLVLAVFTFKRSKQKDTDKSSRFLNNKKMSFVVGFSLAITNPPIMFWWLAEIQIVKDLGIYTNFSATTYALFLMFGGLGLFSYLSLLSFIIYKIKHFISEDVEKRINLILSIVLIIIAIYFFMKLIGVFHGKV